LNIADTIDNIVTKTEKIIQGYSIANVYRALLYSALHAATKHRNLSNVPLKPLEEMFPKSLLYQSHRELSWFFSILVKSLDEKLSSIKPVVFDEANIEELVSRIKASLEKVDNVIVYDCMSLIEFIVVAASLRQRGYWSKILDIIFLNPLGVTRFVTQQLPPLNYRAILREFAHLLAKTLEARNYTKSAYIDLRVHAYGSYSLEEFIKKINIAQITEDIADIALTGTTIVTTDHGYDVVYDRSERYLYVTHGYRGDFSGKFFLLPLSRFSFFMEVHYRG